MRASCRGPAKACGQPSRNAVWVGIPLVVLIGFFPPWTRILDAPTYHLERSAGYAPVFLPPQEVMR